jgi:hypothetical protein
LTFLESRRKRYGSEREYEVRAKEALARSLSSLVPAVRRAWAGAKPQPEDWAGIGRIAPPVWRSRRSLVGHPQAEAEGDVALLSKKPVDTGTGDLFASPPRPDLPQEYKAALEREDQTGGTETMILGSIGLHSQPLRRFCLRSTALRTSLQVSHFTLEIWL